MRSEGQSWRLIRSGYLPGAMNMALDDALLHAVAAGSPPVLRLYRWQPATLTVGYAQSLDTGVDLAACTATGIDVVRRPTGGRAVLHDREVTYAVIAPAGTPFGASIAESYRVIAGVLQEALRRFGLPVELVPGRSRGEQGRPVCFTAPAQFELVIDGCKVAGCAQKRRGPAFLQHGSIPVDLDLDLLQRLLPATPGEAPALRFRTVGWLNRFATLPLEVAAVEAAVIEAFAAAFGFKPVPEEPTAEELAHARQLLAEWYGNPGWTLAGPGWRGAAAQTVGD